MAQRTTTEKITWLRTAHEVCWAFSSLTFHACLYSRLLPPPLQLERGEGCVHWVVDRDHGSLCIGDGMDDMHSLHCMVQSMPRHMHDSMHRNRLQALGYQQPVSQCTQAESSHMCYCYSPLKLHKSWYTCYSKIQCHNSRHLRP
jgi:hypothetical protein